jgi:phasin
MNFLAAYAQNQAKTPDAPQVIRDVAEKTTAQAKETFQQMSAAAGEATNVLKNSCSATFKGTQNYGAKVLEFANANINAAVEQSRKLSSVTSPMEFFALSNNYARQQFETCSRQVQELAAITQSMTTAMMDSVKAGVHKAT